MSNGRWVLLLYAVSYGIFAWNQLVFPRLWPSFNSVDYTEFYAGTVAITLTACGLYAWRATKQRKDYDDHQKS